MISPVEVMPVVNGTESGAALGVSDRMAALRERAKGVPKITWSNQEKKQVAQQCALLYRDTVRKFTAKHFEKAQAILSAERQKKQFTPTLLGTLRGLISEVPLTPNPEEDTAAVHNGGYDRTVSSPEDESEEREIGNEHSSRQPAGHSSVHATSLIQRSAGSDATEAIVALLININLKALSLKSFTAGQIMEAVSNPIDAGRLRNLTVQANNMLTYFEQLLSVAQRA